jgi:carbonic anhydrase/acetyltransferase-like protein (isoleucine patch superfamily)
MLATAVPAAARRLVARLPAAARRQLSSAVSRHRPMMKYGERRPVAANDAFVAPNATVVGRVELRDEASIWYGAVVRGDHADVSIGSVANVQDRAVIETVSTLESGFPASVTIGDYTSVGAGSCLKSCVVEHTVDIGEGCVIDQGAVVQNTVILEPGSVVPAGALITSGGRWAGNPASLVGPLPEEAAADIVAKAEAKRVEADNASGEYDPAPGAP